MENGEFGELPEGDKGGVYVPSIQSISRKMGIEIRRMTYRLLFGYQGTRGRAFAHCA